MIWILSILTLCSVNASGLKTNFSTKESYDILFGEDNTIHATTHITNIIRNGTEDLTTSEIENLEKLGISSQNGKISTFTPNDLDQVFESEHFRFHYTNEGTDAISDPNYIFQMAEVFEEVYSFYIDTLNFSAPVSDPASDDILYDVFVENLPTYYFGITYTKNTSVSSPACVSYIKMRNNYDGSQFSEHTELENVQVTAVHEFFHAIQFSYNCYERFWFMEATAVWSEDELYNNVNDHYRYISSWFSNINKSLDDESSHMYGSFIFFQYIDEHLGGPNTIRLCWEKSHELASPIQDNSIESINAALSDLGSSFEETYLRMRIANKIMNTNAGLYSYEEADGYRSAGGYPLEKDIFYQKGIPQEDSYFSLDLFETIYYKIHTSDPVKIEIIPYGNNLSMTSIAKVKDQDQWSIKSGNEINIDTEMDVEWITLLISAIGFEENNWDYTIELRDGFSEDFSLKKPFPNPSFGKPITINLEVINGQEIATTIYNILGQKVWAYTKNYTDSQFNNLIWDGLNMNGKRVSSGLYFIEASGEEKTLRHKIIFLKDE